MAKLIDLGVIRPGHPMWTDAWTISIGGRKGLPGEPMRGESISQEAQTTQSKGGGATEQSLDNLDNGNSEP